MTFLSFQPRFWKPEEEEEDFSLLNLVGIRYLFGRLQEVMGFKIDEVGLGRAKEVKGQAGREGEKGSTRGEGRHAH
jgi:hypothetical protein